MRHRSRRLLSAIIAPFVVGTLSSCGGGTSTSPTNPLPALFSTQPATLDAGAAGTTVTLIGDGFVTGSRARWNDGDRPTTFVSRTQLRVTLTSQDVASTGFGNFTVINPAPGGGVSATLAVPIQVPLPSGVTALALSGRPHGVATASNGVFYVSQIDGRAVTKGTVNAATQSLVGTVDIGADTPAHVALDPNATRAYTANQFGQSVSVVDVATNTSVATIPLPDQGFNLLVSPDGTRLYVSTAGGHLYVIDTGTRQIIATVTVGVSANGLALNAQTKTLYVSSIASGTITAIDLNTNTASRTYTVSQGAQRIALSPDATTLYIASESAGLEVLDLSSGSRTSVSGVPGGTVGLALSPDGARLILTFPPAGTIRFVDRTTLTVTRTLNNMGTPRNVAFAANGAVAIVTDENGRVLFLR